jgi:hypothetical protein
MRGSTVARAAAFPGAIVLAGVLASCTTAQVAPPAPAQAPVGRSLPSHLLGRRFEVIPAGSRLTVLVYRAGALAMLGHDHVVSCRCLSGMVYLPRDPLRAGFDLRVSVEGFTVDDPKSRAAEHSADFPPDVPQGAQMATRHNMLSAALLNGAKYPDITLRSEGLRPSSDGKSGDVVAQVLVQVAGQRRSIAVPMHYDMRSDEVAVSGTFPLKLTDLGLVPFSAAGGALKVRDAMTVRLSLVARRARGVSGG